MDVLPTERGGNMVIEVNSSPGWRELQAAIAVDLVDRLVEHMLRGEHRSAD